MSTTNQDDQDFEFRSHAEYAGIEPVRACCPKCTHELPREPWCEMPVKTRPTQVMCSFCDIYVRVIWWRRIPEVSEWR